MLVGLCLTASILGCKGEPMAKPDPDAAKKEAESLRINTQKERGSKP